MPAQRGHQLRAVLGDVIWTSLGRPWYIFKSRIQVKTLHLGLELVAAGLIVVVQHLLRGLVDVIELHRSHRVRFRASSGVGSSKNGCGRVAVASPRA